MMNKTMTISEKIFIVSNYVFLIALSLICLFPFITIIAKSVSEDAYVVSGQIGLLPKGFQLEAYKVLLKDQDFLRSFTNSVFITVVGTALQVFFTACVGYAVTKRDLPGHKVINILYVFSMLFSGGLIPTYLVIKQTGLINNLFVLVLPGLVTAFNLILVRNYFEALPYSLEESARMDGAGNLTVLFKIMLPISLPSLATISIFCAVGIWNNYMGPMLYLSKRESMVLSLFLQNVIQAAGVKSADNPETLASIPTETFRAAAIFISALPILMIYPFLQKYFIKGMTLGAVKQ